MFDFGKGVPQDLAKAMEWYQKAAAQGDGPALCNLAVLYYNGEGVKPDREKAYQYLLMAQAAGDPRAANLADWVRGNTAKKDIDRAADEASAWQQQHPARPASFLAAPEPIVSADALVAPQTKLGVD
jgi:TPR repeat protein